MIRTTKDIPESVRTIVEHFYLDEPQKAQAELSEMRKKSPEFVDILDNIEQLFNNPPNSVFLFYDELIAITNAEKNMHSSLDFSISDLMSAADGNAEQDEANNSGPVLKMIDASAEEKKTEATVETKSEDEAFEQNLMKALDSDNENSPKQKAEVPPEEASEDKDFEQNLMKALNDGDSAKDPEEAPKVEQMSESNAFEQNLMKALDDDGSAEEKAEEKEAEIPPTNQFDDFLNDVIAQKKQENKPCPNHDSDSFGLHLDNILNERADQKSEDISLDIDIDMDFESLGNDFNFQNVLPPDEENPDQDNVFSLDDLNSLNDAEEIEVKEAPPASEKASANQSHSAMLPLLGSEHASSSQEIKAASPSESIQDQSADAIQLSAKSEEIEVSLETPEPMVRPEIPSVPDVSKQNEEPADISKKPNSPLDIVEPHNAPSEQTKTKDGDIDLTLDFPVLSFDDLDDDNELNDADDIQNVEFSIGNGPKQAVIDSPTITPFSDNNPISVIPQIGKTPIPNRLLDTADDSDEAKLKSRMSKTPPPGKKSLFGLEELDEQSERITSFGKQTAPEMPAVGNHTRARKTTASGSRSYLFNDDATIRPTALNLTPVASPAIPVPQEAISSTPKLAPVLETPQLFRSEKSDLQSTLSNKSSLFDKARPTSIALTPILPPTGLSRRTSTMDETSPLEHIKPLSRTPRLMCKLSELSQHNEMNPRAGFLISLIDGHTTISDILDISAWPEKETASLLLELEAQNIIVFI